MTEFGPSGFPPDEAAPTLSTYYDMEPTAPVHYSKLKQDPEAQLDLKTWARMYYQLCHLDSGENVQTYAFSGDEAISVRLPVRGEMDSEGYITYVSASFTRSLTDGDKVHTRTGFELKFDLLRPGYVTVFEAAVGLPETIPRTTRFEVAGEPEVIEPGLYMASTGDSVAFWDEDYLLSLPGAQEVIDLLSAATAAQGEQLGDHFEQALEYMDAPLAEACRRYYVDRKSLIVDPEVAFKETTYEWARLPTQFNDYPFGLIEEHRDRLVAYAPPGTTPSDSEDARILRDSLPKYTTRWIKAIWENDKLPGDYIALFTDPTALETVSLSDFTKDLPREAKEHVIKWAQDRLAGYKNWIEINIGTVDSVHDMDEAEFNERKRAHDEDGENFYWGLMSSWTVCLRQPLRGVTYEENVDRYAELEAAYGSLYADYVDAFVELMGDHPVDNSIWPDEAARLDFFRKLKEIETELQGRPDFSDTQ